MNTRIAMTLIIANQYSNVPNAPMLMELITMSATEYTTTQSQTGVLGNHHCV